MQEQKFDPQRIATLLHYEKIPNFVMNDEQAAYLARYREFLAQSLEISDDDAEKASIFDSKAAPKGTKEQQTGKTNSRQVKNKKASRKVTRK